MGRNSSRKRHTADRNRVCSKIAKKEEAYHVGNCLSDLPNEIIQGHILQYLCGEDIYNLTAVGSSRLRAIAKQYITGRYQLWNIIICLQNNSIRFSSRFFYHFFHQYFSYAHSHSRRIHQIPGRF